MWTPSANGHQWQTGGFIGDQTHQEVAGKRSLDTDLIFLLFQSAENVQDGQQEAVVYLQAGLLHEHLEVPAVGFADHEKGETLANI